MKEELKYSLSLISRWKSPKIVGEKADYLYHPFLSPFHILISKSLFWCKSNSQGTGMGTGEGKVQPDIKAKVQKRAGVTTLLSAPNPRCTQHTKRILLLEDDY